MTINSMRRGPRMVPLPVRHRAANLRRTVGACLLVGLLSSTLGAQLDADFTAAPVAGTNPFTVDFVDTSTGGTPTLWFWSFGDGGSAITPAASHVYDTPGVYTVSLTVFDGPLNFDTETKVELIEVLPAALVPDFTATPTSGTNPLTVDFTDTSTGAVVTAWSWDFGDGNTSTEPAPSYTYITPGSYSVTLTAFVGGQEWTVSRPDLIDVAPAPLLPLFSATPTSGTNPLQVQFTDETLGTPPTAWLWNLGDGSSSTEQHPSHTYTAPGTYSVALAAFVGGQSAGTVEFDLIQVDPVPLVPEFTADVLSGGPQLVVRFTDLSSGVTPTAYHWSFGDGAQSTLANPVHIYNQPGLYDVTLTVSFLDQHEVATKQDLITVFPLPSCIELGALSALDGTPSDQFGGAVAVSGTRALIGSRRADATLADAGAAYLFDLTTGVQLSRLDAADPSASQYFGESVALEGDLALVGAYLDDTQGSNAGAAYLFDVSDPAQPVQTAKLLLSSGAADDAFGLDVALSGHLALVGAPSDDDLGLAAGSAWLFDITDPANPIELGPLFANDAAPDDFFGQRVALHGDRALIGATGHDASGDSAGAAYLFDLTDPTLPVQIAKLLDPDGEAGDDFGSDVVLTAEHAIVGAPDTDEVVADAGSALIYDALTGGYLTQVIAPDGHTNQDFGRQLAATASLLLVGAPYDHDQGTASGTSYLFDLPTGSLRARLSPDTGSVAQFFGRVALDGPFAVVGASGGGGSYAPGSGTAYVFDAAVGGWTDLGQGLSGQVGTPQLEGTGSLIEACDLLLGLTDAAPSASTFLVIGLSELGAPFKGGVLVPSPDAVVGLFTDASGRLFLPALLPPGFPPGTTLVFQHWIVDAAGPSGFAASNAVRATIP